MSTVPQPPWAPLSDAQQALLVEQTLAPTIPLLNIGLYFKVDGELDGTLLRQAVAVTSQSCDAVCTVLRARGGVVGQEVCPDIEASYAEAEFRDDATALQWGTARFREPYTLFETSLYRMHRARLPGGVSYFFCGCHHVMGDGWAVGLFVRRVFEAYRALHAGDCASWSYPLFRDYLGAVDAYRGCAAFARDAQFWNLRRQPVPPALFHARREPGVSIGAPAEIVRTRLSRRTCRLLGQQTRGATPFQRFVAAIYAFFAQHFGQDDLPIGISLLNRSTEARKQTIGHLTSVVMLRIRGGIARSYADIVADVAKELLQVYRHHRYPPSEIVRQSEMKEGREPLFCIALTYLQYPCYGAAFAGAGALQSLDVQYPGTRIFNGFESAPVHVSICDIDPEADVRIDFTFNAAWWDREDARSVGARCSAFIEALAEQPGRPVLQHPVTRDRNAQIARAPGSVETRRVHELVGMWAARTPQAVAVDWGGETLSYADIDRRSELLANVLVERGIQREQVVALCVQPSPQWVIGVVAIWKAGAIYMPLDPAGPPQRTAWMLEDADAKALVTETRLLADLPPHAACRVLIDELRAEAPARAARPALCAASGAYLIYTSGSSGLPKGVIVPHGGLSNLAAALTSHYRPNDRVLQFARATFDASIWEILALTAGACLCLPRNRLPLEGLTEFLIAARISVATLPPAAIALLDARRSYPDLGVLISAGEACPPELAQRWSSRCQFVNAYGPTETTVCASEHLCKADAGDATVPIGQALPDVHAYVLDDGLEPVPQGAIGELFIGGRSVARGYSRRAGLTAQRFMADPFAEPGSRMYRTGDQVRRRPDGALEFLSRTDRQLKIRGHRIEPGEIEAALLRHRWVRQAAVVDVRERSGETRLRGYVVLSPGATLPMQELRTWLARSLPEYMVPALLVTLEQLPLTNHGKIDRASLRAKSVPDAPPQQYAMPLSVTEQNLLAIWTEVLSSARLGLHDNFFEVGGTSVSLARVHLLISEKLGRAPALVDLLAHPTISSLAQHLQQLEGSPR